jgi:hypothetical protein
MQEFPTVLAHTIDAYDPDIILFDDLFDTGLSAVNQETVAHITATLSAARVGAGTRVVKTCPDAWWIAAKDPRQLFGGLGGAFDLIQHCNATLLGLGEPREKAAVFCYPAPQRTLTPTVQYGSIPRAAFVGRLNQSCTPRLVFWAETASLGVPFDFHLGVMGAGGFADWMKFDDLDYANVLRGYSVIVDLSRRNHGVPVLVGRTIEVPLCGGALIEEDSVDAAYFLKRGIHYVPFTNLADLGILIPRMMSDPAARERMAALGQEWCSTYFTGDHYWAGVLSRLSLRAR